MVKTVGGVLLGLIVMLAAGCGSSKEIPNESVEQRFHHAKQLFDDEDYLEAINEFTVITLQYQGSTYAGDAQYYLGECRFKRAEYLLAAFEFSLLRRNFPASARAADAQFELGLSYYMLAPKSSLDQQYTRKAIDEFQTFLEYYPNNERAVEAGAKIRELTTRLAKKEYETARLYATMEYYKASLFYYDDVIEKYHDTEYAPLSYLEKTELLIDRKKYKDAEECITKFITLYPNSVLRSRADALLSRIQADWKPAHAAPSSAAGASVPYSGVEGMAP